MNPVELVKKFKATILLTILLLLSYFLLSSGEIYIPDATLSSFSFSLSQPLNIIFYNFIHTGLFHLIVNLSSLIIFALIVESVLGSRDVLAIFFFASILAAITFVAINPDTALIGSSAGISGLLGAGMILKTKRAFAAAVVISILFGIVIAPALHSFITAYADDLKRSKQDADLDLNRAIDAGNIYKIPDLNKAAEQINENQQKFKKGRENELEIKTDPFIHGYAAGYGIIFLWLFRRKKFWAGIREFHGFLDGLTAKIRRR
ncbi:MAG: rhomboid family intramembrane serine protease [Candidatus Diapherotrites archaeon]